MKETNLPDFDDLYGTIEVIRDLSIKKSLLEIDISSKEADIIKITTADPDYFINNKPPSISYIKDTYKYTGITGELIVLRKELAEITITLEYMKNKLDLYKSAIDIWRTEQANKRMATL